ncbi:MAG: hypothetical protein FWC76_03880 [Defluviitaleaceae bacterium]|nr:hypothetical protein [Defluviitaleaceae bacterium]
MKKLIYFTLACILMLAACGNQAYYQNYTNYPYLEPEPPAPAQVSTATPTPTPSPEPIQPPHYNQTTGRIVSIKGLVNNDGTINQAVDWLHVNIKDEDGTPITLVATPATVVPFGNLFVGETVTGFLLADRPSIADEPHMYIASMLAAGMPDGLNIHAHYFEEAFETRFSITGNAFLARIGIFDRLPDVNSTLTSWGNRIFVRTEDTIMTPFYIQNYGPTYAGFAILYTIPEPGCTKPIPIIESILISESFDARDTWEDWQGDFHVPEMFSLSDFKIVDMPLFIHQELLELPMPPILYHDGTTVMVPFKPIGQELWWSDFILFPSGPMFGTIGGGSGETALMMPGGYTASGTGFSARFSTPVLLVDGILYVPLFGFFAGASPFPPSDAFIYNNEIHIVSRGWSILHDTQFWRAGWGGDASEGHQITADVSRLPIYVSGERMNIPSAFLTEDKYDIMLPVIPITHALGFCVTTLPCGCISIEHDTLIPPFLIKGQYAQAQGCHHEDEIRWWSPTFVWIDGELYAPFWNFFRGALNVGGFANYSRIELFPTGTNHF